MPVITSKYPGKCRNCRTPHSEGDQVFWVKGVRGVLCLKCHSEFSSGGTKPIRTPDNPVKTPEEPMPIQGNLRHGYDLTSTTDERLWSIDWNELKELFQSRMSGKRVCQMEGNHKLTEGYVEGSSWRGYSTEDLTRWLKEGFQVEGLILGDPPVPIREKRKLKFQEDEGEFHYDRSKSGEDSKFSTWTKKETIPGLAIEAEIAMSADVSHEILNAYAAWVCRAVYSLEENGVDCQVSLKISTRGTYGRGYDQRDSTLIRVKRENEIGDFQYWSPMISPAALRGFSFLAMAINGDVHGRQTNSSLGAPAGKGKWAVAWNENRRVLEISCDGRGGGYSFPEEEMTRQLHEALAETRKG